MNAAVPWLNLKPLASPAQKNFQDCEVGSLSSIGQNRKKISADWEWISLNFGINHQERVSRKGAKAQSRSRQRAPINQGFAFFLCVTSAFAGNRLVLLLILN
jgi:hypothetical protein